MSVARRGGRLVIALLLGCTLPSAPGHAFAIERLRERIVVERDGSARVERTLVANASAGAALAIPVGIETLEELTLAGCASATATASSRDGVRQLLIERGEGCSPNVPLTVRSRVASFYDWAAAKPEGFGNRTIGYRFVNTQPAVIKQYECELVLPRGFVVSAVRESVPAPSEKNPVPPFQIIRDGDRNGVRLCAKDLAMGDEGMIRFRFKGDDKPVLLLAGGLVAAFAYLVGFRDLVRKRRDAGTGAPGGEAS